MDLHAAVDPDSGHFMCHYFAIAPVIVEVDGEEYPGLNVGENLTVLVGREPVEAVKRAGEQTALEAVGGEGAPDVDQDSLALALYYVRHTHGAVRFYRLEGALAVVSEGAEREPPTAVIVWKPRREKRSGAVLTV